MGSGYASGVLMYPSSSSLLMRTPKVYSSQTVIRVDTLIDLGPSKAVLPCQWPTMSPTQLRGPFKDWIRGAERGGVGHQRDPGRSALGPDKRLVMIDDILAFRP